MSLSRLNSKIKIFSVILSEAKDLPPQRTKQEILHYVQNDKNNKKNIMQLYYREKGNPSLPPLILLHGLWGASENWLPVATLLSDRFHVILPDFRNHGNSPWDAQHDYDALSEDILYFIEQFQWEQKPFIAGHSMGGKALMTLVLKQPEKVAKAAIIDIAPCQYDTTTTCIHSLLLDFILKTSFKGITGHKEIYKHIHQHFPTEELCQLLLKNLRKTPEGWTWKINAVALQNNMSTLTSWPFSSMTTGRYHSPILFLKGELSEHITPENYSCILDFFPAAQLSVIPQATHRIHTDQPRLLAESLAGFFLSD